MVVSVQPAGHAGVVGIGQDPLPHGVQVSPALGHAELVPGGVVVAGAVLLGVPAHELIALPVGQPAHVLVVPDLHGPVVVGLIEGLIVPEVGVVVQGVVAALISAAGGGAGIGVGIRAGLFDLPHQGEGGEAAGFHREGDAVVCLTDVGYGLDFAVGDVVGVEAGAAPVAVVPVQVLEVEHLEGGAGVGPLGIAPVDGHVTAGLDPGVAVVGVHQIEVLDLVLAVFVRAAQKIIGLFLQHLSAVGRRIVNDAVEQQGRAVIIGQLHAGIVQGVGGIGRGNRHGGAGSLLSGCLRHQLDSGGLIFLHRADGQHAGAGDDGVILIRGVCLNLSGGLTGIDCHGEILIHVHDGLEIILSHHVCSVAVLHADSVHTRLSGLKAVETAADRNEFPLIFTFLINKGQAGQINAIGALDLEDRAGQGTAFLDGNLVAVTIHDALISTVATHVGGQAGGDDRDNAGSVLLLKEHNCIAVGTALQRKTEAAPAGQGKELQIAALSRCAFLVCGHDGSKEGLIRRIVGGVLQTGNVQRHIVVGLIPEGANNRTQVAMIFNAILVLGRRLARRRRVTQLDAVDAVDIEVVVVHEDLLVPEGKPIPSDEVAVHMAVRRATDERDVVRLAGSRKLVAGRIVAGHGGLVIVARDGAAAQLHIGDAAVVVLHDDRHAAAEANSVVIGNLAALHDEGAAAAHKHAAARGGLIVCIEACAGDIAADRAAVHGEGAAADQHRTASLRGYVAAHLRAWVHVDLNIRAVVRHGNGTGAVRGKVVVNLAIEVNHAAVTCFVRERLGVNQAIVAAVVVDVRSLANLDLENCILRCDHVICATGNLAVQHRVTADV